MSPKLPASAALEQLDFDADARSLGICTLTLRRRGEEFLELRRRGPSLIPSDRYFYASLNRIT